MERYSCGSKTMAEWSGTEIQTVQQILWKAATPTQQHYAQAVAALQKQGSHRTQAEVEQLYQDKLTVSGMIQDLANSVNQAYEQGWSTEQILMSARMNALRESTNVKK